MSLRPSLQLTDTVYGYRMGSRLCLACLLRHGPRDRSDGVNARKVGDARLARRDECIRVAAIVEVRAQREVVPGPVPSIVEDVDQCLMQSESDTGGWRPVAARSARRASHPRSRARSVRSRSMLAVVVGRASRGSLRRSRACPPCRASRPPVHEGRGVRDPVRCDTPSHQALAARRVNRCPVARSTCDERSKGATDHRPGAWRIQTQDGFSRGIGAGQSTATSTARLVEDRLQTRLLRRDRAARRAPPI